MTNQPFDPSTLTEHEIGVRQKLCQTRGITLNGLPAKISGYRNEFATVTQIKSGLSVQWAWGSAFLNVTGRNKGAFKS